MKLQERMFSLVGHEVVINAPEAIFQTEGSGGEIDDNYVDDGVYCEGILEEVGDDYILIKALDKDKGGVVPTGTEYYAHLEWVNTVTHIRDCKKCAVDSAVNAPVRTRQK